MPLATALPRISVVALCVLLSLPAWADTVELNSGEKLEGEIIRENEDEVVLEHAVLGRVTIPREDVKQEAAPNPGLFGSDFLLGWHRSVAAGISGSAGVSSDLDVNATLDLNHEGEHLRHDFVVRYFYSQSRKDDTGPTKATKNQAMTRYVLDWLFADRPYFLFGTVRYDYDQFEAWDSRLQGNAGVGYQLFKTDSMQLRTRVGAGVSQEFGPSDTRPEGLINLDYSWDVVDGQRLVWISTFYPNFDDIHEWRLTSEGGYTIALGIIEGLGLRVGYQYEYDTAAVGKNYDLKYLGNLTYSF